LRNPRAHQPAAHNTNFLNRHPFLLRISFRGFFERARQVPRN
jgi:hypothetical protein